MRIQESEYRIQKKNNTMVILSPDSWLLYSHASLCPLRAWLLVTRNAEYFSNFRIMAPAALDFPCGMRFGVSDPNTKKKQEKTIPP